MRELVVLATRQRVANRMPVAAMRDDLVVLFTFAGGDTGNRYLAMGTAHTVRAPPNMSRFRIRQQCPTDVDE